MYECGRDTSNENLQAREIAIRLLIERGDKQTPHSQKKKERCANGRWGEGPGGQGCLSHSEVQELGS